MSRSGTDTSGKVGASLVFFLALLAATSPLSIDFYLPAFPQATEGLGTTPSMIQLTLTSFLAGLGLGQVLWGPITDRFGRHAPLVVSSMVALAASLVCVFAPTVEVLIVARFVQALFASAGMVCSGAIVGDLMRGFRAAHMFSIIGSIRALAPVVAPIIGGALIGFVPWRGMLAIVAGIALLQLVGVHTTLRETLPPEARKPRVDYANYLRLLVRPSYILYVVTSLFVFGTVMSYISSSSFVYQSVLGWDGWMYGLGFGVNAAALFLAGQISARLAKRKVHPARTVWAGVALAVTAAVALVVVVLSPLPAWNLVLPLWFVVLGVGFCMGNINALAQEQARDMLGSGAALAGGITFVAGAAVSPIGALWGEDTAVPMAVLVLCCATLAATAFAVARRHHRRHPELEAAFHSAR